MAVLKCKMCGGDIAVTEEMTVADCRQCGSRQTVPMLNSGKKLVFFSRACRLLRACDFDKASGVYQGIAEEFPTEAEAYWGLVLCRYGVAYLDDPETGKKVPACHRASGVSVFDDADFEQVLENAEPAARRVYREEAKAIERAREAVMAQAEKEPPYDIFICHKENREDGSRTAESYLAQKVFDSLTQEGFRVFFCREVLDGQSSVKYEPVIFSALNSARIMLVFGTDYEHFNAPWVKNAWSRFLALAEAGQQKTLIPCYRDIDAFDMPKEFSGLESFDLGAPEAADALLMRIVTLLSGGAEEAPARTDAAEQPPGSGVRRFLSDPEIVRRTAALIAAGTNHTAGVRADGKVIAVGYTGDGQCSVAGWRGAVAVAADLGHTVALKEDGTVTAAGKNDFGQCNVAAWTDIAAIAAGASYTVGLKSDGTVVAVGKNDFGQCNVTAWTDIVAIAADVYRTIGLKSDGTVVVAGWAASLYKAKASAWRDIAGISSGSYHTVGIKEDGSVTAVGSNGIPDWQDIVAVSAGLYHSVGLKSDGTVVAAGDNKFGQCSVSDWRDIVAVAAGAQHTVGVRLDGTVVAVGNNKSGQCEVSDWKLFSDLGAWMEKIIAAEVRRQEREVLAGERRALKKELASLHGLFSGKRRKEIEERLAEIDLELEQT